MQRISLCRDLIIECPNCKTSISFKIPEERQELSKLLEISASIACPRCGHTFGRRVSEMMGAIQAYNLAANRLMDLEKNTGFDVKFGV